jgi:hypothetical protein
MEFSATPWLIAVVGGTIILGIAIAFAAIKSSQATRRQRQAGEQGARDLYHKDEGRH